MYTYVYTMHMSFFGPYPYHTPESFGLEPLKNWLWVPAPTAGRVLWRSHLGPRQSMLRCFRSYSQNNP